MRLEPTLTSSCVQRVRGGQSNGKTIECVGSKRYNHEELCELVAQLCVLNGRYRKIPVPAFAAERVLRLTDRLPRFRPMWSAEDIVMRRGRDACATPGQEGEEHVVVCCLCAPSLVDTRLVGVEVVVGGQTIESNALLWLRRFREARSMNQVVGGRGSDFVHPYVERDEEATGQHFHKRE